MSTYRLTFGLTLAILGFAAAADPTTALTPLPVAHATPTPAPLVRDLPPLSIRGTNYYPQATPWDGMWAETPEAVWAADMQRLAGLNINAIRTFISFNEKSIAAGLFGEDGSVSPRLQQKISRFQDLAWSHGIRVMFCFCLEFHERRPQIPPAAIWQRTLREIVAPRKDDGRVLMWDLLNEPERLAPGRDLEKADGRGFNPMVNAYLKESAAFIKQVDPNHLVTIGQTFRIDHLADVVLPDITQIHVYAPKAEIFAQGPARVIQNLMEYRKFGQGRPTVIGEFGISTNVDPTHGISRERDPNPMPSAGTEDEQHRYFEIVYQAAEQFQLPGVMSWCLYDFEPTGGYLTPSNALFGLLRLDGTEKPAAELTRQTFARWAAQAAPANTPNNSKPPTATR